MSRSGRHGDRLETLSNSPKSSLVRIGWSSRSSLHDLDRRSGSIDGCVRSEEPSSGYLTGGGEGMSLMRSNSGNGGSSRRVGLDGSRELSVGEVEARGEGDRGASVFGASKRVADTSVQTLRRAERVREKTHRPPRVPPAINAESHTTSIDVELSPMTTPFRLNGTPPAPASWTMMTRSPSAKT